MRISITLPGFSCMVPVARSAVRALLPGNPRAGDAELIVSELATSAIRHSHSRGAHFELTLDLAPGRMRIEVEDGGPVGYPGPPKPTSRRPPYPVHPWTTMHQEDLDRDRAAEVEEYGHGLALIAASSDKWGHSRYPGRALWWAELAWAELAWAQDPVGASGSAGATAGTAASAIASLIENHE